MAHKENGLKRIFSVMLAGALTASVFVNSAPSVLAASATVMDRLNLRSGPGGGYDVIKVMDTGTSVTVLDSSNPDWTKIQLSDGTQGYCSSEYLQAVSAAATTQDTRPVRTLTMDTRSYTMAPKDIYDFRAKVDGEGLKQENVKVYSSRTGIATVARVPGTDKYRITGVAEGVCYVISEISGVHASIKVTVQKGVKKHGDSARSVSIVGYDTDPPASSPSITLDTKSYQFSSTGKVYQFLAKGIAKGSSPTASSSNPSVASVTLKNANDSRGYLYEVKALAAGTATITISLGGASAQMTVTVGGGSGTSNITLDTKSYQFSSTGKTYQFLAKGIAKGSSPTASSSNPSVASVTLKNANDSRGYLYEVKSLSEGTATIAVSLGSSSAQMTVTVGSGSTTSNITLDTNSYQFSSTGKVYQFLAKGIAKGSSPTASSSDPSVASVTLKNADDSRGYLYEIKSLSEGSTVVTVSLGSASAQMTVTVTGGASVITGAKTLTALNLRSGPSQTYSILRTLATGTVLTVLDTSNAEWTKVQTSDGTAGYVSTEFIQFLYGGDEPSVSGLTLSNSSGTVPAGKTYYIKANVTPSGSSVTWTSSNNAVATVSNGFIYAVAPGSAAITASDAAGEHKAVCNVTVTQADPVKAAYTSPNIAAINQSVELVAVTDNTRGSVRFVVEMNDGTSQTFDVTNYTEEVSSNEGLANNYTRVWKASVAFPAAGTYRVTAYSSTGGGVMSSTGVVTSSFVVSSQDKSVSTTESRRVSDEMLNLMCKWEGYSAAVYPDKLAYNIPTIGYGQTMSAGAQFYNNLTKTEAWALLLNTTNGSYTSAVNTFIANNRIKVNQHQFDAMISFSHNIGSGYWNGTSRFDIRTMLLNSVVPPTISSGGSLPATASLNFDLYPSPDSSGTRITEVGSEAVLEVLQTMFDPNTNSCWYQVRTVNGTVGWGRSAYIRFNDSTSLIRDLNYADAVAIGSEWLAWNQAGSKVYAGLVYRRLGEAKVFSFGNYAEADSSSPLYKHNTYGYIYPDSAKQFEA